MINFHFNLPRPKTITAVTFLGSILDPFEMSKIKTQNNFSRKIPIILSPDNQRLIDRAIREPVKPNLSIQIRSHRKANLKSLAQEPGKDPSNDFPLNSNTPESVKKNLNLPQVYEHLKLYKWLILILNGPSCF